MTIFLTMAYNAEKTLRRAVDSVLNQTCDTLVYYIVDNGSTDGTRRLVKEYAEQDKRIFPFYFDTNNIYRVFDFIQRIITDSKGDYLVILDSDDEYKLNFLEYATHFIKENKLEFAAGGSDFIDAESGRQIGTRGFSQNILISNSGFAHIETYYAIIRTIWCKIFSIKVLKKIDFNPFYDIRYGADTALCLRFLEQCDAFGIMLGTHYKYYVSPKSDSYFYDPRRIKADRILLDMGEQFLVAKCGSVNSQNRGFLFAVYMNAIKDTLNILLNANINVLDKLDKLRDIFQSAHTQRLIQWDGLVTEKSDLFRQILQWVLSQRETNEGKGLNLTADLFVAMNVLPSKTTGWPVSRMFMLLTRIKAKCNDNDLLDHVSSQIISIASKSPFLAKSSMEFLNDFCNIVVFLLQEDEEGALRGVQEALIRQDDLSAIHAEELLTLGLNLSAFLERADDFIAFKKRQIAWLVEVSRLKDAWEELDDWNKIMPNDSDFNTFRKNMEKQDFEIQRSPSN